MKGIYCITNPSGKIYIGSSKNIERRFNNYKKLECKQQTHIYNSLVKYGVENHTFQVIYECDEKQLLEKEQMCIDFYKPELNISKKVSAPMTGRKHTEETKEKLKEKRLGRKPNLGNKYTEETKKKMSASLTGLKKKRTAEHNKKISVALLKRRERNV